MVNKRIVQIVICALLAGLVWAGPLNQLADQYAEEGLQRALSTFAAARGLNALISLLQGTAFNVEFGVGATIQPGAVLDPLDDLVEQFSSLMLMATLSFGLQKWLLTVLGGWGLSAAVTAGFAGWIYFLWRNQTVPLLLQRLTLAGLFFRLAIPIMALGSEWVYDLSLAQDYRQSQAEITVSAPPSVAPPTDERLVDKLRRWWEQSADIGERIEKLKQTADQLTRHLISLSVVFLAQTLFLPLLFLWLMRVGYRLLIQ